MAMESTTRGPYSRGMRRRGEIIDAAVRVFGSRGYGASTLKQIADEVGVTTAAVLRYFSKEELLTEVLRHWDSAQPDILGTTGGLSFFRGFQDLMDFHLEHRGFLELFLTFVTEATDPDHPAHRFLIERHARAVQDMRSQLVAAVAMDEIPPMDALTLDYEASAFCATIDGFEIQWLLDPAFDLVGFVTRSVEQSIDRWRGNPVALDVVA